MPVKVEVQQDKEVYERLDQLTKEVHALADRPIDVQIDAPATNNQEVLQRIEALAKEIREIKSRPVEVKVEQGTAGNSRSC